MIIESIRLKHIKSYGAGEDGNGVTVPLQPGVNRIAGANGHGKTTLVEALGYALFLAEPVFEENFKIETYLLAHGAKAGEIDVTFRVDGASYRLERGVGAQSKRRAKVIEVADGSICAEGDQEVSAFLCRLLALPSPARLQELFSKLVGVKQGRLAWPFDSKPADAKRFFEPLLEVDVFRQCFDRLKPVTDAFARDRVEREKQSAVLGERIRERSDAGVKLEAAQLAVAAQVVRLERAQDALQRALDEKTRQEALQREVAAAGPACDQARDARRNAADKRDEAEVRLRESEEALGRSKGSEAGYHGYQAAVAALEALEERRARRDLLRKERAHADARSIELTGALGAACDLRDQLLRQHREKCDKRDEQARHLLQLRSELQSGRARFEGEQAEAAAAGQDAAAVAAWVSALPALVTRMASGASDVVSVQAALASWNPAGLAAARTREREEAAALAEATGLVAQAEERARTLSAQLGKIAGGICPFLNESCLQFDPARVQADISHLDGELADRRRQAEARALAHREAESSLQRLLAAESGLRVKRERLAQDLANYAGHLAEVLPAAAQMAAERLCAWDAELAALPRFDARSGREGLSVEQVPGAQQAVERFGQDVASWWPGVRQNVEAGLARAAAAKTDRTRAEAGEQNRAAQLAALDEEIRGLEEGAAAKASEAEALEVSARTLREAVRLLDVQLEPLEGLDPEIQRRLEAREANRAPYETYLQARPLADDVENRRDRLGVLKQEEQGLAVRLAECEERLRRAQDAFDAAQLTAANARYEAHLAEVAAAGAGLEHAEAERAAQDRRFEEWKAAVSEQAGVATEIARCSAAIDLTELARRTLRNAAPAVAQHLCTRIALRAQAVFNQINPDPVELWWDADHYSLRITPGDRRFAMLSGGEQTKLALAMTLAMVEEFSRLRLCVFDEPTYGVDAESRGKLADAILQVQDAAGLDQLLLVSHDDAFEGRIEHTVVLRKSAAGGTTVEIQ